MDMSPTAQVTASSSPTPGDATGALSVGAFDATTLLPESYSSEGPTDDGRLKPDIAAPTNVLITPGDPESDEVNACGGTSCATPHVGGAAALLWGDVAADGGAGSVAQRVRDRLVAQALDVGAPGAGLRVRRGPPAPRPRARPCSARPRRRPTRSCAASSRSRSRSPKPARSGSSSSRSTASRSWRTLAPGGVLQAAWPTAGLASGPHVISLVSSDQSGNVATYTITLRVDNDPPKVRLRAPTRARARAKVHVSASVLDVGSGLVARPRITFGDGSKANGFHLAHRYKHPGRYTVTIRCSDRAGNSVVVRRTVRILPAVAKPTT